MQVFSFFLKHVIKTSSNSAGFFCLLDDLTTLGKHLSVPWRIAFLSLDRLPRFYPLHFQHCEILPSSLNTKCVASVTPSGTSSSFCHRHFLIYVGRFTFSWVPRLSIRVSDSHRSNIPRTSDFPCDSFYVQC